MRDLADQIVANIKEIPSIIYDGGDKEYGATDLCGNRLADMKPNCADISKAILIAHIRVLKHIMRVAVCRHPQTLRIKLLNRAS